MWRSSASWEFELCGVSDTVTMCQDLDVSFETVIIFEATFEINTSC
jgi:hypothetical protein